MKNIFLSLKFYVFTILIIGLIAFSYIYKNKTRFEQSEVKQVLQVLVNAEENYFSQFGRYSSSQHELGVDFSKLSNISIYFDEINLPLNINLASEERPYVNNKSFRILVIFKTSRNTELWKAEHEKNSLKFLRSIN